MTALIFCSLWAFLLLAIYLAIPRLLLRRETPKVKASWLVVLTVALVARLIPNFVLSTGAGYDIQSYKIVGDIVLQREDVYSSQETENRHPYLPMQMYWMALSSSISEQFHLPFERIVRLAPIFEDATIALVLYFALLKTLPQYLALMGGLLYAVNPISTYVSAYHGQFDALPALFTLLAFYWFEKNIKISGAWLGLGILAKSWPILSLPPLLAKIATMKKKLIFVAVVFAVLCIGIGLYVILMRANPLPMLSRVTGYNRGIGVWGYTYFFRLLSLAKPDLSIFLYWFVQYGRWITLIGLGLVWWWMNSRRELPQEIFLATLVSFFTITHAFAIQYLAWIVPFAILCQEYQWLKRFILAAFAYMFLTYTTLILGMYINNLAPLPQADWFIIIPAGLPAWLVCIGWSKKLLFNRWEVDKTFD